MIGSTTCRSHALICAQAVAANEILLTSDQRIRAHLALARWDD